MWVNLTSQKHSFKLPKSIYNARADVNFSDIKVLMLALTGKQHIILKITQYIVHLQHLHVSH